MKLQTDVEHLNAQQKLADLEHLIEKREHAVDDSPAHQLSLESMRRFAAKLRAEIEEYEHSHQTT